MAPILQWVSILTGFAGAVFWFLSASGKVPSMLQYWDLAPTTDPFYQAFVQSVQMNKIAAALTGVSVLFGALATLTARFTRGPAHPPRLPAVPPQAPTASASGR